MKQIILKKGREKSALRHHPWIFSGAIHRVEGDPEVGEPLPVVAASGETLGVAGWSPASQLAARFWSFEPGAEIGPAWLKERLKAAFAYRRRLGLPEAGGGARLAASEADGLPGLIVDVYGEWLVVQFTACAMEYFRDTVIGLLAELWPCRGIYERSDLDVRRRENLPPRRGLIVGEEPPELVELVENGLVFLADIRHGHKTGFYFDQRDNRSLLRDFAAGKRVLNLFSYTGGFGVAAVAAGAECVVNVDSSAPSLALAARNMAANGIAGERFENLAADAFEALRGFIKAGRAFDVVVLDPPKFVDSAAALVRGCRAYKDIALKSFGVLAEEGRLFTFSCSGLMSHELFQKITADAALDAGREAAIQARLGQAPDHPTPLAFPEACYLKGLAVNLRS